MTDFRLGDGMDYEVAGFSETSTGLTVLSGGAWEELIASTAREATSLRITMGSSGTSTNLVDIGVGASGAEVVLVPNLITFDAKEFVLPVAVAQGSRIAARGAAGSIGITLIEEGLGGPPGFSRVTDYGTDLTNTRGTLLAGGGTWTEITASMTHRCSALLAIAARTFGGSLPGALSVGLGASGAEQALASWQGGGSQQDSAILLPASLPAGTRLAMRNASVAGMFGNVYGLE